MVKGSLVNPLMVQLDQVSLNSPLQSANTSRFPKRLDFEAYSEQLPLDFDASASDDKDFILSQDFFWFTMLGLDAAGKTTILYKLHIGEDWIGQYDAADELTEYIHRVGRTVRGEGAKGNDLLFLIPEELHFLKYLKVRKRGSIL